MALPAGAKFAGVDALLPALAAPSPAMPTPSDLDAAVADAARRLSLSVAYIAVDNISHALGNFIDDQQWHSLGLLFAKDGWRAKSAVAFCVGPEHVEECERNYDGVAALPRASASGHWLIQPVIDVAPDGTSAKMRHRLLHIDAAPESRGFSDGMYPNNAAKLENGVWKFDVAAPDQPYFSSSGFKDGWARRSTTPLRPRREPERHRAAAELPARCATCLDADPSSRLVARRHDRVAGHQADVVFLPESGQRPCAAALLPGPQDVRNGSRGGSRTALNRQGQSGGRKTLKVWMTKAMMRSARERVLPAKEEGRKCQDVQ